MVTKSRTYARPKLRAEKRPPKPLDARRLNDLALHYVARFATSAAKLADYLRRKLRERGWEGEGEPDVAALTANFVAAGYIDDAASPTGSRRIQQLSALPLNRFAVATDTPEGHIKIYSAETFQCEMMLTALQPMQCRVRKPDELGEIGVGQ